MTDALAALTLFAAALAAVPASAAEIHVMSGGAPKEVLNGLVPAFERASGYKVTIDYILISALRQKIIDGATPDMVIMPTTTIDGLVGLSKLSPDGRAAFGTVRLVAIVKAGAKKPDISTPEAFREALAASRALVYSTPTATPSGAHMAQLVEKLGLAEIVAPKVTYRPALEGGVQMVADGKADLGIYPASEVAHVTGVDTAGPLPDALQLALLYAGAVTAANATPGPARDFIRFLTSAEHRKAWEVAGFVPAP